MLIAYPICARLKTQLSNQSKFGSVNGRNFALVGKGNFALTFNHRYFPFVDSPLLATHFELTTILL